MSPRVFVPLLAALVAAALLSLPCARAASPAVRLALQGLREAADEAGAAQKTKTESACIFDLGMVAASAWDFDRLEIPFRPQGSGWAPGEPALRKVFFDVVVWNLLHRVPCRAEAPKIRAEALEAARHLEERHER